MTNTATVTINVSGMIWFINASGGGPGDGRLGNPFNSIANFNALAADDPNDSIFLFESATGYSGAITLLSGQKLIGQDATATLAAIAGVTVPPFSNALPAMNSANGTVTNLTSTMTLVANTTLRGFSVNTATSTGISGGAVTGVTTSELRVTTTTGTAVSLSGTGGTISFTSISSNGAANGISLLNTTGSFTVTGDGGACSVATPTCTGGRIQNTVGADGATAGIGVRLQNANAVSLTRMRIDNHPNFAIRGLSVTGFTLDTGLIDGTHGSGAVAANDEGAISFTNLLGSAAINNSTVANTTSGSGAEVVLRVINTSGTLDRLTIDNSTIFNSNSVAGTGDDGMYFESQNSAVMKLTINNSHFTASRADLIQTNALNSSTMDIVVTNTEFRNNNAAILSGGGGTLFAGGGTGSTATVTFNITGNTFRDSRGHALGVFKGTGTANFSGTISNNTVGVAGIPNSGTLDSSGDISVESIGAGTMTVLISGNTLRQYNEEGIRIFANSGSSVLNATVIGNTVTEPGTLFPFGGVYAAAGAVPGDTCTLNLLLGSFGTPANQNTLEDSDPFNANDVYLERQGAATFNLSRGGSAAGTAAGVVQDDNVGSPLVVTSGTITLVAGSPPTPFAPPAYEETANIIRGFDNKLNFPNASLGSLEWRAESGDSARTISGDLWLSLNDSRASRNDSRASRNDFGTSLTDSLAPVNDLFAGLSEVAHRLSGMISPTAHAQETKPAAPESGETVTKSLGTLPAGESIVVKFRATVDNGPYASGVNNITNTATISGSNFANVNSTTSSIALDAAPDLVVTKTEGGGTTQPGATLLYTLTYSNTTATNGQNAANVVLTETVPANTTFNATASLPSVWSCANGSAAGTVCTINIGAVNAGAAAGTATFAVNVLAALPAGVIQISNTSSIAENPNVNGTDRNAANNTGPDTTNIIGNWLGGTSTDWFNSANWSNGVVPPAGNNVSIPNVANQPIVTTADVTLNNMNLIGENVTINTGRTITVNGVTTLGANIVNGAGTLNLGTAATITRTTGQVECTMNKNFGATGLFTFPVGTTGAYSPVDVNVTAGTGQLSVKANNGTAPLAPVPLNAARTLQRYWTLSGSGITSNITFNYLNGDVPGLPNNENIWNVIRVVGGTSAIRYPPGPNIILNAAANTFTLNGVQVYSDWTAGEPLAPTAGNAAVSGRVLNRDGRGLSGSVVSISDGQGNIRYATTNPFGYYRFVEISVGQTYVISVRDKRFQFAAKVVNLGDDLAGVDFTP
ncbi:MAG: carboxypeptidase-like regulatory domain-containing protein [Pyrinomonadaceae bacterium]